MQLVGHALEIEWWGDALDAVEDAMENMKREHAEAMCGLEQTHAGAVVALKAEAGKEARKKAREAAATCTRGRGEQDARLAAAVAAHAVEVRSMEERHVAALKDLRQRLSSLQQRAATPAARGAAETISSSAPSSRPQQRGAGGAASPPESLAPKPSTRTSSAPPMGKHRPDIQVDLSSTQRLRM